MQKNNFIRNISNKIQIKRENLEIESVQRDKNFVQTECISNRIRLTDSPINKKELIKSILKGRLYNSLAQAALKTIFTPFKTLKLLLTLFIFISIGLASYLVIQSVTTYFNYGVSTTFRIIYETPTLFPKVTFCNINLFTTEYAYNLTRKGIFNANNMTNEEKKKVGHQLNDILIKCTYNLKKCSAADFKWSFDDLYGNCYTFNSGFDSNENRIDFVQTNVQGPNFGLQLILYVNSFEKLIDMGIGLDKTQMSSGILIHIQNSTYSTYYSNFGILVSAGSQTNIAVDREFHSILPKPYSECEIDSCKTQGMSDLYNLIDQSEYDYTQQLCYTQCVQKQSIKVFNCTFPYIPSLYNETTCNWTYEQLTLNFDKITESDFMYEVCKPLCPLECDQILYKTSISSSRLNANSYFISKIKDNPKLASDFIHRNLDPKIASESFVYVSVFYNSLFYTISNESPQMSIVSLLASIGGNLGLFLGVSAFSLCETVEVAIEIIYVLKSRK